MRCRFIVSAGVGGHAGTARAILQHAIVKGVEACIVAGSETVAEWLKHYGHTIVVEQPYTAETPLPARILRLLAIRRYKARYINSMRSIIGDDSQYVLSTGSIHGALVAYAGHHFGKNIAIVEDEIRIATLSKATMATARIADTIFLQWPEQLHNIERIVDTRSKRIIVAGPVYGKRLYPVRDKGYILVAAGATVSHPALYRALEKTRLPVVIVSPVRLETRNPNIEVHGLMPPILFERLVAGARIVVTHQGRTGIEAAYTYGKPVIIVQNPRLHRWGANKRDIELYAEKINAVIMSPRKLAEYLSKGVEPPHRSPPEPPTPSGAYVIVETLTGGIV